METLFTKPKRNRNILGRIFFWTLFLIISVLVLIPTLSGSELNIPYRFFAVESGSMRPLIEEGDLIVVKTQNTGYNIGDIITFKFKGSNNRVNNTHRIVDIHTDNDGSKEYITKGDFNSVIDVDPVTEDRIVGKYVFGIPYLGYPIRFVQTVPGLILLIVIPSTVLIYEEIQNIKRELNKRKQYSQRDRYIRRNNTYQK